jgi:hypothetical protein
VPATALPVGAGPTPSRPARVLFVLTTLWGAAIFWVARHPPMADLAQHAGQVMLLRDLLFGPGRWSEVVRLNWFTPYLIGYLLSLPLSLVLPIAAAMKVVLSLAYLAFVWMCVRIRAHFAADARLDWLFLVSFFGVAYRWGFVTFLVAGSIALGVLLLSSRYARQPSPARGVGVFVAGLLLLASHGLAFLFGWASGVALLAAEWVKRRFHLAAFLPHALLALGFAAYFLISRTVEADFNVPYDYLKMTDFKWTRLVKVPLYTVGMRENPGLLPLAALLLAVPWLYGLRPSRERSIACIPFALVVSIMLFVPSFALNTAFLYERFALFLLPAYAWMFAPSPQPTGGEVRRWSRRLAPVVMVASCWILLGVTTLQAWRFGQETRELDAEISRLEPYQRALILVFDGASEAASNPFIYIQYPAWYQAEREGMVDFNFAWFPPQIVRFRPGHLPPWRPGNEWRPERFDWRQHEGAKYRYFFIRDAGNFGPGLFKGADCVPTRIWSSGVWEIFERRGCPAPR